MTARDSLKAKIAALRAKTTGAGCTEAEALAAAELAAELMRRHGLSEAELALECQGEPGVYQRSPWRSRLDDAIGYVTNTHVLLRPGDGVTEFTGRPPGPQIACYLRDLTHRAVEAELGRFKKAPFYLRRRTLSTRRHAAADFCLAMATRLAHRLIEIFAPSVDPDAREQACQAVATRLGSALKTTALPPPRQVRFDAAALAGWRAGEDVPLNRGVGDGGAPRKAIGSG